MKLRITLVLDRLEMGGAEKQAIVLGEGLVARGHDVTILGSTLGAAREYAMQKGLKVIVARFPSSAAPIQFLSDVATFVIKCRATQPDCVVGFTYRPNVLLAAAWRLTGARAFVWNQRDLGMGFGKWPFIERLLMLRATSFITNSNQAMKFLVSSGVPRKSVDVIHNGVQLPPPSKSRIQWREELAVEDDTILVAKIANLTAAKDHATLVRALPAAQKKNIVVVMAGRDDGQGRAIRQLADSLDVSKRLRIIGEIRDVSGLLTAADVYVQSSASESSSNAIVEATLSGVPVICSDIPANREALPTLPLRHFFKTGDHEDLVGRLRDFASDQDAFRVNTKEACALAVKMYSVDRMVEDVIKVIDRACS